MPDGTEWVVQIDEATRRFVDAVAGTAPEIWAAHPPTGPWSLSQVVEHVAIANDLIFGVFDQLRPMTGPPDITDDEMPYLFYGGEEPPHVQQPSGTWTDMDEAIASLQTSAGRLAGWARTAEVDLDAYGRRHPMFGVMSAGQWLRFSAVHTWRHRTQVISLRRALEPAAS